MLPAIGSDVLHWDGKQWSIAARHTEHLLAIHFANERCGWAVGKNAAALRFDGSQWREVKGAAGDLHDVFYIGADKGWMVNEAMWSFEGSNCRRHDNPTEHARTLYRVACRGGKGWAVGVSGAIAYFDGSRWTAQSSPEVINALRGLSIVSERDVWAVGERGMILRFDGRAWQRVAGPDSPDWERNYLHDVHFIAPNDGWAVGGQGTILHYDGSKWSLVQSPTGKFLLAVHFNSPNDGWAAGGNFPDGAVMLRYDGSHWTEVSSPTQRPIQGLCFVAPNNGWAVASAAKPVTTQR
jgi:photosystem II stability/assembly factor-like uncharacterized protein